ncbi:unnamed protein product [Allacma fusca]|uniref:Bromo domain-containing protein n=1 Tax=Allacma fusca TaxID=39272 RepID=A0A8J2P3Z5_9HEXA|nr:unnamed protein product [Allacma fusca]
MENTSKMKNPVDLSQINREIYFLVAKFLSGGPMVKTAKSLIKEIEENELVPDRVNWLGESVKQDFRQYSSSLSHVTPDHLPQLLQQLLLSVQKCEGGSRSLLSRQLLGSNRSSDPDKPPSLVTLLTRKPGHAPTRHWGSFSAVNSVQSILSREIRDGFVGKERITPNFYTDRIKLSSRCIGHLTAVYCVLYDKTGRYIFTGADDKLVKVWSAVDGRLLATLRGATAEITDMAINHENTLLAVGSNDKLIRVWSLRNCESLAVLNEQQGQITSVFFCPMPNARSPIRYLASTATDGSCAFWAYTELPGKLAEFQTKPTIYQERMRPGHAQILCASFSSGGVFMAAGSADNNVRVYYMLCPEGPQRILEVECHKEKVDSISWAHRGVRFISGSKDGTALVYRFECQQWRYVRIHCCKPLPGEAPMVIDDPRKRPRVTMVAWNTDDSLVFTATSDFLVKAWNSTSGNIACLLKGHTDEIYVIESHPFNSRIVCTAGHDGMITMWNVGGVGSRKSDSYHAEQIFTYRNHIEGHGNGSIFDCKLAPDGLGFVATDALGHLLIFGTEDKKDSKFSKIPSDMFFHTDYRPFISFPTNPGVTDDQTQVATHLMPPPFLVNADGNPYPPEVQRLVPGRERCNLDQLVPLVAVSAGGAREIIEGLPQLPLVQPLSSRIDAMIAELAARNERGDNAAPAEGDATPGSSRSQPQSRDLNNIQTSTATWQPGHYFGHQKNVIVPPLPPGTLHSLEMQTLRDGDEEEEYYQLHLKKAPAGGNFLPHPISPTFSPSGRLNRVRRPARRVEPAYFRAVEPGDHNMDEDEGVARPNPPQQEISYSQGSPRRMIRPSNSVAPRSQQPRARQPRRVRYNVRRLLDQHGRESDPENVDNIPSSTDSDSTVQDMSEPSSSETSEESDSDWQTRNNDRESKSKVKRSRRHPSSSPHRTSGSSANKRKRKKVERVDSDSEDSVPRAGPSSAVVKVEVKTEPGTTSRAKPKKKRVVADVGGLDEIPEQFRPPDWLSEVMPKRSPYFPQLGDDLVYFRQGHELYVNQVENQSIYDVSKKMKKLLPYNQIPDLPPEISVRVVSIKFEIAPPRLVVLTLERTDWETGENLGGSFTVRYHDMPSVVDFFVLRQIYDKSVRHRWNVGDRFRCMMDRTWWLGTVSRKEPCNTEFSDSNFLSYWIKWDGDEQDDEQLSPWDMEIITDDFAIPTEMKEGIPASDEDLRNGLYEVRPEDWEPHGHQDAECQRISSLVACVMDLSVAEAFLTPVDLNLYPDYAFQIEYLIDLNTIKSRLDNLFYRRSQAILTDIEHIAINAEKFNEPGSDIVRHAKIISSLLREIVDNDEMNERTVSESYRRLVDQYNQSPQAPPKKLKTLKPVVRPSDRPSPDGPSDGSVPGPSSEESHISCASRLRKRVPKVKNRRRVSDSDESSTPWQRRCKDLLQIIWSKSDAMHFRHPVDTVKYPDYTSVVDTPMCLNSIKEDLAGSNYSDPHEFDKDMLLIFENSRRYNTDLHSPIRLMTCRLKQFYEANVKKILSDYDAKRRRNRTRPQSLRTPNKTLRSSRPHRTTRSNVISTPTKAVPSSSSSPRKTNFAIRNLSPMATRNGPLVSPRKRLMRDAAARHRFIRTKSTDTLSPPKNNTLSDRASSSTSSRSEPKPKLRKTNNSQKGDASSTSSRNRRTNSSLSGSAGSASTDHDNKNESVPTSSRNNRKRRRISSGESTDHIPTAERTPRITRSPPQTRSNGSVNGGSPNQKLFKEEPNPESDNEQGGRYQLRNKCKSSREESSSPDRNTGHNLRQRPKRVLRDYDSDEFDEEEEEKENVNGIGHQNGHESEGNEDREEGNSNVDGDESEEVTMPNLKREADDSNYEEGSEEEESEFEGEEASPSPPNNLRRSSRKPKVTKRLFETDDEHSEASEYKHCGKLNGRRRRTRHGGKASKNYRENGSSDDDE